MHMQFMSLNIFCIILSVCSSSFLYLERAISVIQRYNRVKINDIIVIINASNTGESSMINEYAEDIFQTSAPGATYMFLLAPEMSKNLSNLLNVVYKNPNPCAVIFYSLESLEVWKAKFPAKKEFFQKRIYLVISMAQSYQAYNVMHEDVLPYMASFESYFSSFLISSQMYIVAEVDGIFQLYETYQKCKMQSLAIKELSTLSGNHTETNHLEFIWDRRSNLDQCSLRVGYIPYSHFLRVRFKNTSTVEKSAIDSMTEFDMDGLLVSGHSVQFFALMKSSLNFSVNLVYVQDEKWGEKDPNTNDWLGIIGMITRGEIDTFMGDLTINKPRSEVIDFTRPLRTYRYKLFMKRPGPAMSWITYINVFNLNYWRVLIMTLLMCSICLFIVILNLKVGITKRESYPSKGIQLGYALTKTARAFLGLDINFDYNNTHPTTTTMKVLIITICICGVINYHIYNAGLISSLMVQKYELPVNDISDILHQQKYKLSVHKGTADEDILKYSQILHYRKIYRRLLDESGFFNTFMEGEDKIRNEENMIVFANSPMFEMSAEQYPCGIVSTNIENRLDYGGYVFEKGSPYVDLFSHYIVKIKEKGVETDWYKLRNDNVCKNKVGSEFRRFSYNDVILAFVLLSAGALVAVTYSIVEFANTSIFHRITNRQKNEEKLVKNEVAKMIIYSQELTKCSMILKSAVKSDSSDHGIEKSSTLENDFNDINQKCESLLRLLEKKVSDIP